MLKRFLLALALLLMCSSCYAISAQEAVNFATKQNNFLYPGETVEIFPNTRIGSQEKDYWVIAVLSGGSLSSFVPVLDSLKPGLPDSTIARRNLIKTAYVLRYESQLNESSTRQGLWLFDAKNVKFFSDLSQDLKNERIDLTTVKTSLADYPELQRDVDYLNDMLDEMFPLANDTSDAVLDASSFENSFVAQPDTNNLNLFKKHFLDCFDLINALEESRSGYLADLDSLRQAIALTGLPLETKQGLNSLANIPGRFQQFGSKASISIDLEEELVEIFDNSLANVDNLAADLLTREKRSRAFQALYGNDAEILEEAGHNTLGQLFDLLLADEYFFRWLNQSDLDKANENWEKAKAFYDSGSFQQAEQYAAKAKGFALNVYSDGLRSDQPPFDTGLLLTGLVLLIIAIIIIYALRNREKILGLVSQKEEEVQLRDWEE